MTSNPTHVVRLRTACPCGSGSTYAGCCARWHMGPQRGQAPDARQLMQSRYSAYVLDEVEYLLQTWHPATRPTTLSPNEPGLKWLGLQVLRHDKQSASEQTVEFVARSRWQGRGQRMHEISRFVLEEGQWYYVSGEVTPR